MANISKLIPFENLKNIRDLGGMKTADGHTIREGLLFRAAKLFGASEADLDTLDALELVRVYDFRTASEREEKPDPVIGMEINIHLPILREAAEGITREKKADSSTADLVIANSDADPDFAKKMMQGCYLAFVRDEYSIGQYGRFLKGVLAADGGVLWHCSGGKDRTGFAALLLETILGVSREDIMADYLATNDFLGDEASKRIELLRSKGIKISAAAEAGIRDIMHADACYIDALYQDVEAAYGSMEGFIREALGVDDDMRERFRQKYLF